MPSQGTAHRVITRVKPVAAKRGEVDPADERDLAVDDDQLLVMAVHRTLMSVECALDARATHQLLANLANGCSRRLEDRQRGARPEENPDVDGRSAIAEQIAQAPRLLVTREAELRSDVPAGDVDMRAGARDRFGDAGQGVRAVDQHLQLTARPRRRVAGCPERSVGWRAQLVEATGATKAPAVMGADRRLEAFAYAGVDAVDQGFGHRGESRPGSRGAECLVGFPRGAAVR